VRFRREGQEDEAEAFEGVVKTVVAGCGGVSKSKEVALAPLCDLKVTSVVIEELDADLPTEADEWGAVRLESLIPKISACVEGGEKCAQLEEVEFKFSVNTFRGDEGPQPISGADDPAITPDSCESVLLSLTPLDRTGELPFEAHQGEPVPSFEDFIHLPAVEAHEERHRADFLQDVLLDAVEGFQDQARSLCQGCEGGGGPFPLGAARIEWAIQYEIHRAGYAHNNEARALRVSNEILESLVLDIITRLENAPNTQQFPPLCRGLPP